MSDHLVELEVAWQRHVGGPHELLDRLLGRHREKQRRYHTATHVLWVIRHVRELVEHEAVDDLDAVVAAALYHDAIYEPVSPANERASARLATRDLTAIGWESTRIERVASMIEGTTDHRDPVDVDTAVLFDADLAILAADPGAYDEYRQGVRAEYRHVSDDEWVQGRGDVLRSFLGRASIYATETGRRRWEERARANLTAELASLDGP